MNICITRYEVRDPLLPCVSQEDKADARELLLFLPNYDRMRRGGKMLRRLFLVAKVDLSGQMDETPVLL